MNGGSAKQPALLENSGLREGLCRCVEAASPNVGRSPVVYCWSLGVAQDTYPSSIVLCSPSLSYLGGSRYFFIASLRLPNGELPVSREHLRAVVAE
jgi:hypothetical protein